MNKIFWDQVGSCNHFSLLLLFLICCFEYLVLYWQREMTNKPAWLCNTIFPYRVYSFQYRQLKEPDYTCYIIWLNHVMVSLDHLRGSWIPYICGTYVCLFFFFFVVPMFMGFFVNQIWKIQPISSVCLYEVMWLAGWFSQNDQSNNSKWIKMKGGLNLPTVGWNVVIDWQDTVTALLDSISHISQSLPFVLTDEVLLYLN